MACCCSSTTSTLLTLYSYGARYLTSMKDFECLFTFCRTTMTITRTLWPAPAPWLACTQVTRCRFTCTLSPASTTSQETASLSSQDASWKPLIFSVPTFLSAFFSVKVERTVVANFVMRQMTKEVFESQSLFFLKKDHFICQSVFLSDSLKNMWSTDLRAVFD